MITQEEVKRLFIYDPNTGIVTRRININSRARSGNIAGIKRTNSDGKSYFRVQVNGKEYALHRLIYMLMTGEVPDQIDHINGNGLDNRWNNLRNVSQQENAKNCRKPSRNTSGIVGVSWHKHAKKWEAHIRLRGKRIHLGNFIDINQARIVRKSAEIKHGFHPNHGADRPL